MTKLEKTFQTGLWSVRFPNGWIARQDDVCVTLTDTDLSALQMSAATKDARPVTQDDLKEFALEAIPPGTPLAQVSLPHFEGFHTEYCEDATYWRKWWLRSGNMMLHVTYNTGEQHKHVETEIVDSIVRTLKPLTDD